MWSKRNMRNIHSLTMEGYLGKKSIHISDSFLHSNYYGIMTNEYFINIAYLYFCFMLIVM